MGVVSDNDMTCRRVPPERGRLGNDLAVIVIRSVVRCTGTATVRVTARHKTQRRDTGAQHHQNPDQPRPRPDPASVCSISAGTSAPGTATTTNRHARHPNTTATNTRRRYVVGHRAAAMCVPVSIARHDVRCRRRRQDALARLR